MANHSQNTSSRPQSDYTRLPFGELLDLLQNNGFIIDANDHAEFTAVFDNMQPSSHEDLKYYLAPIVCRNEDEQKKFYKVFDLFLQENKLPDKIGWWEKLKGFLKKIPVWLWILLLIAAGILIYLLTRPGTKVGEVSEAICLAHTPQAGGTVLFSHYCNYEDENDTAYSIASWNFGDGTPVVSGSRVSHVFQKTGSYTIGLIVKSRNNEKNSVSMDTTVTVCPAAPDLSMVQEGGPLRPGDSVAITAKNIADGIDPASCYWVVNNIDSSYADTIKNNRSGLLNYVVTRPGSYTVSFYYSVDCSGSTLGFQVDEIKPYSLEVIPGNVPFNDITKVNPLYIILFPLLALLSFIAAWFLFKRKIKDSLKEKTEDTTSFTGIEAPFEIPYLPKDRHIQSLLDISKISYNLSRRTEAEMPYLHIPGTIHNSIRNYGLVSPAYKNRQRPREYLILVDDSVTHNQQVHLFSYLIKKFTRENVLIDLYFYYKTPDKFYKENNRTPVNFQKLRDCNYQSSLIIIGKGYELFGKTSEGIDPVYRSEFEWWEKRVLVTPVPSKDWSVSEKTLSEFFYLVPADIAGWISLAQFITEDATIIHFTEEAWRIYDVKFVDTEDIAALKVYLRDDDLFQWLCATAIHHNIRWEILIELGHAILSRNNTLYKLNYTNLLKLARIQWMEEGVFPASTRLALLKELTVENELLARKTMLQLLKESDELIDPSSFTYEEKEVQKYTDSFLLYANNAEANAAYKEDADKFLSLWEAGKIVDTPLSTYLKKEEGKWNTPVRSIHDNKTNISIREYIRERDSAQTENTPGKQQSYRKWARACVGFGVLCMIILAGIFIFKNDIADTWLNRALHFVNIGKPSRADITIAFPEEDCIRNFAAGADSVTISFDPQLGTGPTNAIATGYFTRAVGLVDSLKPYTLTFQDVDISKIIDKEVGVSLSENKDDKALSAVFRLSGTSYELSLAGVNCVQAVDSIYLYYLPGSKEDYRATEAKFRQSFQALQLRTDLSDMTRKPAANYLIFGTQVDSSERYLIASRLLELGLQIRQIRSGPSRNYTGVRSESLARVVEINGNPDLDILPVLTVDSLRCLFLKQCDRNRPVVYIQYDPFASRDSIELFRRSLTTSGWQAPGIERRTYNQPSVVRYFSAEQKTYAETIALRASQYFRQTISSQFVQRQGNVPGQIELWIKPKCGDVRYSNIWRSLEVPYIYMRNPTSYLKFMPDRVYSMEGGEIEERLVNQNMKKCGKVFTLYVMPTTIQQDPNTFFGEQDKGVFGYDRLNLIVYDSITGNVEEQIPVLFDFNNYTISDKTATKDIGLWKNDDGSIAVRFGSAEFYIQGNGKDAKQDEKQGSWELIDMIWDSRSGCRIYKLRDPVRAGEGALLIVYDGYDGTYLSNILRVGSYVSKARSNSAAKEEFLKAWDKSVFFTKVELVRETSSGPSGTTDPRKILWIDDSILNKRALVDSFSRDGFAVTTSTFGALSSTSMLSGLKYDLIILNIEKTNDPEAGLRILRTIRSNNTGPVIIYTSTESASKYGDQARKEGAMEVYIRPGDLVNGVRRFFTPRSSAN